MEENQMKERKEMILSLMNEPSYVPMKIKELAILLEVPKERREELKEVLDALLEEGRIRVSKKGKYVKPKSWRRKGFLRPIPGASALFPSKAGRETFLSRRIIKRTPWTGIRSRFWLRKAGETAGRRRRF